MGQRFHICHYRRNGLNPIVSFVNIVTIIIIIVIALFYLFGRAFLLNI